MYRNRFRKDIILYLIPLFVLPILILSGGGNGGGFIATAAFGSYFNPYVKILRDFRDIFLMTSELGKAFVGWYYRVSPPIADAIRSSTIMKAGVRMVLLPLVGISYLSLAIGVIPTVLVLLLLTAVACVGLRSIYRARKSGTGFTERDSQVRCVSVRWRFRLVHRTDGPAPLVDKVSL